MKRDYCESSIDFKLLKLSDASFLKKLMNTDGWLKFIGQRNIHSIEAAESYIHGILENHSSIYWVVRKVDSKEGTGIISFIKRPELDHWDIGFAFLPEFCGNGFAYQSVKAMLEKLISLDIHTSILAITLPDNFRSIRLIHRLGFILNKQKLDGRLVYHLSKD